MRRLDAGLDLLDRHIVDRDGVSVGKVDDLELEERADGRLVVTALLLGPQAVGPRIGGRLGHLVARVGARLACRDEPYRIPLGLVDDLGVSISLRVAVADLQDLHQLEAWLHDHFIARIPGGRRAAG